MAFWEVWMLGIGLSMDAFAVALCRGLSMKQWSLKSSLVIAGFFGAFQALMPFLGWLLGSSFRQYIESVDHWVAFGLLLLIGGKMILDAVREIRSREQPQTDDGELHIGELFLLALATSIDALAAGLSFSMLGMPVLTSQGPGLGIIVSVFIIGMTTFLISLAGSAIGNRFGDRFHARAELIGGMILVALGVKILLEHLLG